MGVFSKSQIEKKYVIDKKELGSGNFAVVKRATLKPGAKDVPAGMRSECAVKIIDKAKVEDMNDIQREIEVMEQLKHDNVIKVCPCRENPASPAATLALRPSPAPTLSPSLALISCSRSSTSRRR